ncbi:MAG TPA: hybrid sensor histidine kinase/response regulator, partial [Humisphaera sp.]
FLMNRFPLAGPDGEPLLGSISLDVTERQEAEGRIRDLARELESANRLKDQFLSNLSHELRTPITSIRLWTEVLQSAPEDVSAVREAADMIHHSALAQSRLIEDLLDITRVIAGKLKVEPAPISLGDVVRATLDLLAPMAAEREVRVEAAVPPGRQPVLGDARRLQQVAWNLVTNAIKFSKPGSAVRVSVEPDAGGHGGGNGHAAAGGWRLTVADDGMGIPPDLLPKLFERFRQQDSSKTRAEGGLGIGLSIVKYLVEAHGGDVSADSPGEGLGATFAVRLPATAEPLPEPQAEPSVSAPAAAAASPAATAAAATGVVAVGHELDGVRVLLVEDNADSRNGLSLLLRKSGATVYPAETADAAAAVSAEVDVLLSDIGLPERDGCDLVRELRGRPGWADKPAIAISAYALPEDRDRALRSGFDAFVVKPIDPDALLTMIVEWMEKKRGAAATDGPREAPDHAGV